MSRGERAGTGAHGSVRPGAMGTCLAGVYVVRMGHGRWIWWSGRRVRDREGQSLRPAADGEVLPALSGAGPAGRVCATLRQ